MIKKPEELTFENKTFSMILYGAPGVGKTTLALSAPKPVLIDFDKGVSRVKAYHRRLTIVCNTYEEVLTDIQSPEIAECETIVIDTGGSLISYLQDWAIRTNPAQNQQKNGALSLKGYGVVKQEFQRLTTMIRDRLNKNVIYVFHSEEQKDKDGNPQQRLLCEGAAKNLVWQPCDFGGYVQMIGNDRAVSFTPSQEFFAKGCYGIEGTIPVPTLKPTDKNDFLARLFEKARGQIQDEITALNPVKEVYETTMAIAADIVAGVKTVDELNEAKDAIAGLEHALTSKAECGALLRDKAKEIGATLDKATKQYKPKEEK
jgi:hypothetical protein